jgi:hypothetical protein
LAEIAPIDQRYDLDVTTTKVAWRRLPFYEDVALLRIADPSWPNLNLVIYFLVHDNSVFRLNGSSPPIHEVNAKAPIRLTADNVVDYLRFFCFFVRGEEGPFYLAEDIDDPLLPKLPDHTTQSVFADILRPIAYSGINDQGHFLCNGSVFYSNAIFIANFAVQPTGMIEMLEDEPVAADLPVRIDLPLS